MNFHRPTATIFVPDGAELPLALSRTTRLGIGAHQDDLEFMALHGILACHRSDSEWFTGVTCTNGGGSARVGGYAWFTDEEMMRVRREEQNQAATVGRYSAMLQLDYPSRAAKDPRDPSMQEDLRQILAAAQPQIVYTHNPADKHETHVAVALAVIRAIRSLPLSERPVAVYGCEVWRGLDWLNDDEKVVHDVSGHEHLAAALNGIFDSQIAGGKRYDLAVMGRRRANATFFESHSADQCDSLAFAMDLTPIALDDSLDIVGYVAGFIDRFRADVLGKLQARLGN